jgi:hypothetical protein
MRIVGRWCVKTCCCWFVVVVVSLCPVVRSFLVKRKRRSRQTSAFCQQRLENCRIKESFFDCVETAGYAWLLLWISSIQVSYGHTCSQMAGGICVGTTRACHAMQSTKADTMDTISQNIPHSIHTAGKAGKTTTAVRWRHEWRDEEPAHLAHNTQRSEVGER